jgi:penicillin amidase
MAAPEHARFLVPPGQSGNPLSPHYGDLMQSWRDFAWLGFGDDASGGTLLLSPP